jgi:hypothetical protein
VVLGLWRFEDQSGIVCNADVEHAAPFNAVMRRKIPLVTRSVLERYLSSTAHQLAPYSLGYFPYTLFRVVKEELALMAAPVFIAREPMPRSVPVIMTIDDSALVIADDFVVDVPELEHRPEWLRP